MTISRTKGGFTSQIQPGPGARMPPQQILPSQSSLFAGQIPSQALRVLPRETVFQKLKSVNPKGWDKRLENLLKVPEEVSGYDEAETNPDALQRILYFVKNPEDQKYLDALRFGTGSETKPEYLLTIYPRGSSTYVTLVDSKRGLDISVSFGSYQEPEDKRRNWTDFKARIKESLKAEKHNE